MSFSKRNSQWANAALVVSLSPQDVADDVSAMEGVAAGNSPLRGVLWQSAMERRAAEMGGGNLGKAVLHFKKRLMMPLDILTFEKYFKERKPPACIK